MTTPLMIGAYGVRRIVIQHLKSVLPALMNELIEPWDLADLPQWSPPQTYYDYEIVRIDPVEMPLLFIGIPNTQSVTGVEFDDETFDPVFDTTYSVRLYEFVRGVSVEQTTRLRDHTDAAIKMALLRKVGLSGEVAELDQAYEARLNPQTVRSDYSEVTGLAGSTDYVASSFITFAVTMTERVPRSAGLLTDPPEQGWTPDVDVYGTKGQRREAFALPIR